MNDRTYDDAERFNNNYKTCMAMSEIQEMFKAINDLSVLIKPIAVNQPQITELKQYQPAIMGVFLKLCMTVSDFCLQSLTNPANNLSTIGKFIQKVEPTFLFKLIRIRQYGPITQVSTL